MPHDLQAGTPRPNAILQALPEDELRKLRPELQRADLNMRDVLQAVHEPVGHLWFPLSGVCSMISDFADGAAVEVATIGREGVVGLPLLLGAQRSAQTVIVQVPGEGERLTADAFVRLRPQLPAFERLLLRYTLSLVTQIAQGSACNRLHPIESRCARWLLQTHDRVDSDSFNLTHEFLATMLGVTRPSVTIAAGILQRAGLISYKRGLIEILDRTRLEEASCECYAIITNELRNLSEVLT